MKKTDLQILKTLLGLPVGKLSVSEKRSFQAMYDSVASGMQIALSKKQRAWADMVYAKLDLDKARPSTPARAVEVKDKRLLAGVKPPESNGDGS